MSRRTAAVLLVLVTGLISGIVLSNPTGAPQPAAAVSVTGEPGNLSVDYGQLPLYFEENRGQTDSQVRYFARAGGYSMFLTDSRVAFNLVIDAPEPRNAGRPDPEREPREAPEPDRPTRTYGLYLDFVGANANPALTGEALQDGISSYFKGGADDWVTGVPHFGKVRYAELYPGIDAVFYGNPQQVQYDFIVAPGADPSQIRLRFDPVESITLTEGGNLMLSLGDRTLTMKAPHTYQIIDGVEVTVESQFVLANGEVTFDLGAYDARAALVIDPVIAYAGYIGGDNNDAGHAIAVDSGGNAYITGFTESTAATFPEVGGPFLTYAGGGSDVIVVKVNPAGTGLVYAGYIGGACSEYGRGIAVDASGSAYITGVTCSDQTTFPLLGLLDQTFLGGTDAFVVKVNASGTGLVYSGYVGGLGDDEGKAIAVDASGNAYITGFTGAEYSFPVTGSLFPSYNFSTDAFVVKVNAAGSSVVYGTYLGGSANDEGYGIAVDAAGSAYITGLTASTEASFPVAVGPDLTHNGSWDAFVVKINPGGTALVYAGYIGGGSFDVGYAVALDTSGNAYVTGHTSSNQLTFPVVVGPDLIFGGAYDAFVAKVSAAGDGLLYASYVGGPVGDTSYGIAVNGLDEAYLAHKSHTAYGDRGYVARINATATTISLVDLGAFPQGDLNGIAVDTLGNPYVTGWIGPTLLATVGPDLTFNGGSYDAFVAKVDFIPPPDTTIGSVLVQHPDIPSGGWVGLTDGNKTYDGNTVRFTASLSNTFTTTQNQTLRLVKQPEGTVLASKAITLAPGAVQDEWTEWDTLDKAWIDGSPAPAYQLEVQVVGDFSAILDKFSVQVTVKPRPVILVHGWNSDASMWDSYIAEMHAINPEWDGHAANNLSTYGPSGPFKNAYVNGDYLDTFIEGVRASTNAQHVDIVGHSMGGLIGRAYLQEHWKTNPANGRIVVFRLLTLGTPHLGSLCSDMVLPLHALPKVGSLLDDTGLYHFTSAYMAVFSLIVNNPHGTAISALAGTNLPPVCTPWLPFTDGDLVVPEYSALAYGSNNMGVSGAAHAEFLVGYFGSSDYVTSPELLSTFVKPRLSAPWTGPFRETLLPVPAYREPTETPPITQLYSVSVPANGSIEQSVNAFGSGGFGIIFGQAEGINAELLDPSATLVGSLDAVLMAQLMTPAITYESAPAGSYTVRLTNTTDAETVVAFEAFEAGLSQDLSIEASADGSGTLISATVTNGGVRVAGTTVTADVGLAESTFEITDLVLYDDGLHEDGAADDGVYAARFDPPFGGVYTVVVTAQIDTLSLTKATVLVTESTSLVENGSFENAGLVSREAADWTGKNLLSGDKRKCSKPSKPLTTQDGECVFQFSGGTVGIAGRKLSQTVIASGWGTAGETLEFSAWMWGKDFGTGAKVILKVSYANATNDKLKLTVPNGTYAFTEVAGVLPLAAQVTSVKVDINVKAAGGKLYADDVQLTVVPPAARSAVERAPVLPPPSAPDGFRGAN